MSELHLVEDEVQGDPHDDDPETTKWCSTCKNRLRDGIGLDYCVGFSRNATGYLQGDHWLIHHAREILCKGHDILDCPKWEKMPLIPTRWERFKAWVNYHFGTETN